MIIFNNINTQAKATSALTVSGRISSADEILVIPVVDDSPSLPVVTFNGVTQTAVVTGQAPTFEVAQIYVIWNPPVGTYSIVVTDASTGGLLATPISVLGASKRSTSPITASMNATVGVAATQTLPIQATSANSVIIDAVAFNDASGTLTADPSQTQLVNFLDAGGNNQASSYKYVSPGLQSMSWTPNSTGTVAMAALVLEPDDAPSIWYPNVSERSEYDAVGHFNTDPKVPALVNVLSSASYKPSTFFRNSFLHTIGRQLPPASSTFTLAAETELETSQIVLDRITQAASASATSLSFDHLITSQDAVLAIFASNMGVIQSLNSVTLNGVALTSLANNSVSSLAGGVYFISNPNVGVSTVGVSVTLPAALELVAISLLGVDKRTTNPIVATANNATGSPSLSITPAAANSLIFDFVGTLIGSGSEDTSQTPYFDQPQAASGAFGSFKLSTTGPQTMSWTTLGAAWVQFAIALEPANALSMWFPAVDLRNLSDVVQVNGLDDSVNPQGTFARTDGTHPSTFYQNSFLHTVGRFPHGAIAATAQQPLELQLLGIG